MRVLDVLVRDGGQAILARHDFMYPALVLKPFDCTLHLAARQLFNDRPSQTERTSTRRVNDWLVVLDGHIP